MRPKSTSSSPTGHTSMGRTAAWVVPAAVLVMVCAAFWPANLGGRTTYVSTHGTSMLPRFHAGDLAIVRPASDYPVGTIAAYKSETLHGAIVLHRVIAVDRGRLTFKGDNNDFTDPDHPTAAAIVGKLRARVPHGGAFRSMVSRPIVLVPVVALVIFGTMFVPRRKRSRGGKTPSGRPHFGTDSPLFIATALAMTGALVIAGSVWLAPRSQATNSQQQYRQNAKLAYFATTPPGAVYPDGRVRTGDPIFTRMVPSLTIDLRFAFATPAGLNHEVRGTSQIVAEVTGATSWRREIPLTPVRTFGGDELHRTAALDLGALRDIQRAFTAETGLDAPATSVRVIGRVRVEGIAEGAPVVSDLSPRIDFTLTPVELVPKLPTSGSGSDGVSVTKTGSVTQAVEGPRTFGVGPAHLSGGMARFLSVLLVLAIMAACIAAITLDRKRPTKDAAARIIARHRYLLVDADAIPAAHRRPVVRVANMRDLARLAKLHDELVIHAVEAGTHRFALFTDPVVYLFEIDAPTVISPRTELAKWALAGLEAHAATRRRPAQSAPTRRHSRPSQGSSVIDAK